MDIFQLYRDFWDYTFNNPDKIKPNDIAIYSFAIEHCNRLGWKKKFGFPTTMAMEATGIKSYSVYKKHFDNLIDCGFFEIIEFSKNQYSSNIIALKENYKANDKAQYKALDKALIKHGTKQSESTVQSIDSITKQMNNRTIEQLNNEIKEIKEKEVFDFQPEIILKPKSKIELIDEIFSFEKFWAAYPNKIGKVKCEQKYYALTLQEIQKIKDTVQQYAAYKQFKDWTHPNPETYLNQKRWNDVLTISTQPKGILLDPRIKKSAVH